MLFLEKTRGMLYNVQQRRKRTGTSHAKILIEIRRCIPMGKWLLIGYLVVNLIVFLMYGIDKYKATHKKWRIPEATLIGAAVFGVLGALAGMHFFRHKTKKPKFYITVPVIFVLEIVAAVCFYFFVF